MPLWVESWGLKSICQLPARAVIEERWLSFPTLVLQTIPGHSVIKKLWNEPFILSLFYVTAKRQNTYRFSTASFYMTASGISSKNGNSSHSSSSLKDLLIVDSILFDPEAFMKICEATFPNPMSERSKAAPRFLASFSMCLSTSSRVLATSLILVHCQYLFNVSSV